MRDELKKVILIYRVLRTDPGSQKKPGKVFPFVQKQKNTKLLSFRMQHNLEKLLDIQLLRTPSII